MLSALKTITFYILYFLLTVFFSLTGWLLYPFLSEKVLFDYLINWNRIIIFLLRTLANINHELIGKENIPKNQAFVLLSNHQSTWEGFYITILFHPIAFVSKKELFLIPFFGWGLHMLKPIAINRKQRHEAVEIIKHQGKKKLLEKKHSVLIFPEGTRVAPNKTKPFAKGAAILAKHAGVPMLFLAHNAGYAWPTDQWIIKGGTVKIHISEPYWPSADQTDEEITQHAEKWIRQHIETPK